jgi:transposase-like protein
MPSPQDEASRHLMRDRGQLQKEVLQHRDRMSKLLRTLGCWDEVDDKVFAGRLRQLLALRRLTIASATPNLRTQSMIENDLTFLPLRVTRVGVGGKRSFDPADKRRLVDACLQPGASLTGLAVKAGVNANQLRKWVGLREQQTASARGNTTVGFPAFVPVVAIDDAAPVPPCRRRHTLRGPRLNWIERTCRHRRYRVRDCRPDCPTA